MSTKLDIEKTTGFNPMGLLLKLGVRSNHVYIAALLSIVLSGVTWLLSRGKDDQPQSDRWGLFVGEWAPTLFALGVGLKLEEDRPSSH